MDVVRVAVVGCGRIAQLAHLRALAGLPDVRVVALAEPDARCRKEAARLAPPGTALFPGYQELFAEARADAAILTLPSGLHAGAAVAAFETGHHVYLEKPLATTLADAGAVMAAWKRAGTTGMIGFNYRFHPLYRAAREHLRASRLGELVGARTVFSSAARVLPDWKRDRERGGGALIELASHHIDLVHFLFGEPIVEVSAMVRSQHSDADSAGLHLRLAGGLLVQSFSSIAAVAEDRFDIYGREGRLAIDRYAGTLQLGPAAHEDGRVQRLQREVRRLSGGVRRVLRPPGEPSYGAALQAFVSAVRHGRPAVPGLEDGYRSLAVVDAAERSSATGRVLSVDPGE